MVEYSPEVILSAFGLGPVPELFDNYLGSVHLLNVKSRGESREYWVSTEGVLAEFCAGEVAINLEAHDGVGHGDDAASPALVERLVRVGERGSWGWALLEGGGGVEGVKGAFEFPGVYDAGNWQFDGAGGVSLVGVAAIAWHSPDIAVFLLRPDCGLEGQTFFGREGLRVVGIVLLHADTWRQQQAQHQK